MAKTLAEKWQGLKAEIMALFDERRLFGGGERNVTPFQQFLHFWLMVGRSFVANRCPLRASALAYATLLALIPLLAVGIGVSASFLKNAQLETAAGPAMVQEVIEEPDGTLSVVERKVEDPVQKLVNTLVDEIAPQLGLISKGGKDNAENARQEVVKKINEFIANIHSGTLGVTGTIALIVVAILLLSNIETTFNDIWGVSRGRNWVARAVQYWATITLGPLFLVLALGLTVSKQFDYIRTKMGVYPIMAEVIFTFVPLVVLILIFTVFYQLIPNTKVNPGAALIGGLVGGGLWTANSTFNVLFASRVITASKIYGPMGAIPVFLTGMYFSWLILLFGAQVAYAFQNRQTYMQERQAESIHQRGREFVAFRLMEVIGSRFAEGVKPPSAANLAATIEVPSRLVSQMLRPLIIAQLINEVTNGETCYTPARPLEKITCKEILAALRCGDGHDIDTKEDTAREPVKLDFTVIQQAEEHAAEAITVADLVNHAKAGKPS